MEDEQELAGGNAGGRVVRVGSTVRKPWTESTPSVLAFMAAVRDNGVDIPAVFDPDDQGRQVLEFIPGQLALEAEPLTRGELQRVGGMVRAIHDASGSFVPAPDASWTSAIPAPGDELVCHNDLAPWNLILGERWVFIDWDAAAPSTRLWDLAYAAQSFTLSNTRQDPREAAQNLAAFVDGYGAGRELREHLPEALHRRAAAMYRLLRTAHDAGREPWGPMYGQGHGDHWRGATGYALRHRALWSEALLRP